ncbi:hypothetical protein [Gilvimarinus polysaccharolyticus]|uniref:hypothetical protein n=1 Tax=Gilvimarinus polysaccharolyticus TaxID=863921 RepID=UPI000B0BCD72|nr:hypothetical protein [Gilvimarinus polysaccharolyticus]
MRLSAMVLLVMMVLATSGTAASVEIHEHKTKSIGEYPTPKIHLSVFRDAMDGININVKVENYHLNAPNSIASSDSATAATLQGHAHVFVNGIKRQRLYGNDLHIPNEWLQSGVNQIAISLNSHQHENWIAAGQTIVGSVFVDLSRQPIVLHNFSSQPINHIHGKH